MALPESTVSAACRAIVDVVQRAFAAAGNTIQMLVGAPAAAIAHETEHRLNFFFLRFEPTGIGPDAPGDTWWIRAHCVITAFAVDDDRVSAGENDLRLLGEVMRIFHEKPVLDPVTIGREMFQAQMIFTPISLDDINRIWSTQKDVAYRPSVAYEIALVPVVPTKPAVAAARVGGVALDVRAARDGSRSPHPLTNPVQPVTVDTARLDWAARVLFFYADACAETLSFQIGSAELGAAHLAVLIAGAAGATVTLRWEIWDSVLGWRPGGAPQDVRIASASIDPIAVSAGAPVGITMPFTDHAGQALLYAERAFVRPSDGTSIVVRSNPLLLTLYGGGP